MGCFLFVSSVKHTPITWTPLARKWGHLREIFRGRFFLYDVIRIRIPYKRGPTRNTPRISCDALFILVHPHNFPRYSVYRVFLRLHNKKILEVGVWLLNVCYANKTHFILFSFYWWKYNTFSHSIKSIYIQSQHWHKITMKSLYIHTKKNINQY